MLTNTLILANINKLKKLYTSLACIVLTFCIFVYRNFQTIYVLTFVVGVLSQRSNNNGSQKRNVRTLITQCFHEGRWFPAGTIISAGRSMDWCYGSFCDINGKVKHWDDYNCPPPSNSKPHPPFPNILFLSKQKRTTITTTTTTPPPPQTKPVTDPQPTALPAFWFPTTTTAPFGDSFSNLGCFYHGEFYWAGQDVVNRRRGRRCFGTYCDFNAMIQHWQDDCRYVMSHPTRMSHPAQSSDQT